MKKILAIGSSVLLLLAAGCKKEAERIADFELQPNTQAFLKINVVSVYRANPSFQLKVNDTRVSNLITARTPFPGGGFNTNGDNRPDYLSITPGNTKVAATIPNRNTNNDSMVLYTTNLNLEAGKYYTAHITDTAANTKVVLLEDDIAMPERGTSRYKFVHLMPNVPFIDLYHGTLLVANRVPYLGNVVFTRPTAGASTAWSIRESGTSPTSTALATYSSANTIIDQRGYTIFTLGYKGVTSTDARRPFVSFLLNK